MKTKAQKLENAKNQGIICFHLDGEKSLDFNPFVENSEEYYAWREGWYQAKGDSIVPNNQLSPLNNSLQEC